MGDKDRGDKYIVQKFAITHVHVLQIRPVYMYYKTRQVGSCVLVTCRGGGGGTTKGREKERGRKGRERVKCII